jgi:hypothetical protein
MLKSIHSWKEKKTDREEIVFFLPAFNDFYPQTPLNRLVSLYKLADP